MTKDEALRLALEFIPSISPAFICEASHHKKHEQHASNEPCPHVAKQKQVYEAIKAALEAKDEKDGSPCPEFWDWLPKAYRDGDIGDLPKFTKYNMEVAFLAGKQSVALEAKDEPVAWVYPEFWQHLENLNCGTAYRLSGIGRQPLYTTPPQRKPLTDEEIKKCWDSAGYTGIIPKGFARAIEAKLKEKST